MKVDENLSQKTITGLGWTSIAQTGKQVLQFAVTVVLTRLLAPEDFGLLGMIVVFTGFAALFSELGFSAALIQKKTVTENQLSSVFWLNISVGVLITMAFWLGAPLIGRFYSEPQLIELTQVVSLIFLIIPLYMVQLALLNRQMNFRAITLAELAALLISGIAAILLAFAGIGIWSLLWQIVLYQISFAIALWRFSRWRPAFLFDWLALKEIIGYSINLFGFRVLNYWVRNGDYLLIGRVFGKVSLGIYSRTYTIMLLPITQVSNILNRVMFPAFSQIQEDQQRIKRIYLRAVAAIALVTFPLMMGLFIVADEFVMVVLGNQWVDVIPLLKIFTFLGMIQSIGSTVGWIYQSQARTDLLFRWGIISGVVLIGSFLLGIRIGTVQAVAACYAVASGIILLYPSFAIPGRLIGLEFREVIGAVSGIFSCALLMTLSVWSVGLLLPATWPDWIALIIKISVGALVYVLLLVLLRIEAFRENLQLVKEQWRLRMRPLR